MSEQERDDLIVDYLNDRGILKSAEVTGVQIQADGRIHFQTDTCLSGTVGLLVSGAIIAEVNEQAEKGASS